MKLLEKTIRYAEDVVSGKEITTKEVVKQCEWFLDDYNNRQYDNDFEFFLSEEHLETIEGVLGLLNFATGLGVVGMSVLEGLADFQAFFLCNLFGWRYKEDSEKFRYRDITLFIPRKNARVLAF